MGGRYAYRWQIPSYTTVAKVYHNCPSMAGVFRDWGKGGRSGFRFASPRYPTVDTTEWAADPAKVFAYGGTTFGELRYGISCGHHHTPESSSRLPLVPYLT